MKRFISISLVILAGVILLASCRKRDYHDDNNTGRETAVVFDYYDGYPFTIIKFESDLTYAIIEHLDDRFPERAQILDGIFEPGRISNIRNLDLNESLRIKTLENNPTADDAYDALDYYADEYDRINGVSMSKKARVLGTQASTLKRSVVK